MNLLNRFAILACTIVLILNLAPMQKSARAEQKKNRPEQKNGRFATELKTFTNSIGMSFVLVPAGSFIMGRQYEPSSDEYTDDEVPAHNVTISKPFWIGQYEVTQEQWYSVMGDYPSHFQYQNVGDDTSKHPVESVSWTAVQDFIKRLSEKEGRKYRLPTEAEWEYACTSGGKQQKYCGKGDTVDSLAWDTSNSGQKTHKVGTKQPNDLGIYDMSGNVSERVSDRYEKDYYSRSPNIDPQGPPPSSNKNDPPEGGYRGSSWYEHEIASRAAYRHNTHPSEYITLGFRLVLSQDQDAKVIHKEGYQNGSKNTETPPAVMFYDKADTIYAWRGNGNFKITDQRKDAPANAVHYKTNLNGSNGNVYILLNRFLFTPPKGYHQLPTRHDNNTIVTTFSKKVGNKKIGQVSIEINDLSKSDEVVSKKITPDEINVNSMAKMAMRHEGSAFKFVAFAGHKTLAEKRTYRKEYQTIIGTYHLKISLYSEDDRELSTIDDHITNTRDISFDAPIEPIDDTGSIEWFNEHVKYSPPPGYEPEMTKEDMGNSLVLYKKHNNDGKILGEVLFKSCDIRLDKMETAEKILKSKVDYPQYLMDQMRESTRKYARFGSISGIRTFSAEEQLGNGQVIKTHTFQFGYAIVTIIIMASNKDELVKIESSINDINIK